MTRTRIFKSPVGYLRLSADEKGLTSIDFLGSHGGGRTGKNGVEDTKYFLPFEKALKDYFEKKKPLPSAFRNDLPGTDFQRKVWRAIEKIPFGETRSYGEIAEAVGAPRAARAVGSACGRNHLPLFIPCHRVLAAYGKIGGYGGNLDVKKKLLRLEGSW